MRLTNQTFKFSLFCCLTLLAPALSHADSIWDGPSQGKKEADETFSSVSTAGVQKEFTRMSANTEKDFKGTTPIESESTSVPGMIKEIFNPVVLKNPRTAVESKVITKKNTIDISGEISYYRYQEPDAGVTLQGPMEGFYANYSYRPSKGSVLNNVLTNVYSLQSRYSTSHDLEYKGSGIAKNKHDVAQDYRGLIGKDYFIGQDARVTPYFGFGYRYLIDHGNGEVTSTSNYLYDRKSHYYYIPLGTDLVLNVSKNWEIDPNIEYDILVSGYQKSFLSDGNQFGWNNSDIVNHQDHGYGIRASIKFLRHGSFMDYYMEPYLRYWNIDQSKLQAATEDGTFSNSWNEPNNKTFEIGSKFGLEF